ncbi:MAG: hypothetical protein AAFQ82_14315, partial [Myxococcota bacterium]
QGSTGGNNNTSYVPNGEACSTDEQCVERCIVGVCAPPSVALGPCDDDNDCLDPVLACGGSRCVDPNCTPGSQVLTIANTLDDGEIDVGFAEEYFPDGESCCGGNRVFAGHNTTAPPVGPVWTFFRFPVAEPIPLGATVFDARLSLWALTLFDWTEQSALRIRVEDAADAEQVTGAADAPHLVGGRALTSKEIRWPSSGGLVPTLDAYNETPELAALLQPLLDASGGLTTGDHLQLWVAGDFDDRDGELGFEDSSHPDDHPATLTVSWTCPGEP